MKTRIVVAVAGVSMLVAGAVFHHSTPSTQGRHSGDAVDSGVAAAAGAEPLRPAVAARPAPVAAGAKTAAGAGDPRSFGETVRFVVREVCDADGRCVNRPVAEHDYAEYSLDELRVIAGYDGAAAIVLANELGAVDFVEARKWALRGFLLTKDPYAFHMAAGYSGVFVGESVDAAGEVDTAAAKRAYLWLRTGYLLGIGDGTELVSQEMVLDRQGVPDRTRLDAIAERGAEKLTAMRLELTGEGF